MNHTNRLRPPLLPDKDGRTDVGDGAEGATGREWKVGKPRAWFESTIGGGVVHCAAACEHMLANTHSSE